DSESLAESDRLQLAQAARRKQIDLLRGAVDDVAARLPRPPSTVVLSGAGEFLARLVLEQEPPLRLRPVRLSEQWGDAASRAACAYAVSLLAAKRYGICP